MRLAIRPFLRFLSCLAPFAILVAAAQAQSAPCTPSFPLQSGKPLSWQGADAAYSIPLPDGRDVWIFGDTLYGPNRIVVGNDPKMIHNSLGISTCKDGKWHLDYVIRHNAAGEALSFFSPSDPKHWYWALDGFYANGDLWVTLLCIQHATKPAPAGFDFETCGSDLAQVSGLEKDPQQWTVTVHSLVANGVKAYPSATTLVHDGYGYLFAIYENGTRPLVATRIPLAKLNDPAANLEYLAADGTWKPGFDPAKAKEVMTHGSSELSIRYHPDVKQWFAVMVDPGWFSDKIILRTAPDLTGPWTDGSVIYTIPEMKPGPAHDKNVFCYAGKEHPEFESDSNLVFTYVCNTMSPPELVVRRDIYHPQVIRQPMPATLPR
jgi:hypothetical protein